jgi:hypothetical protein
VKRVEDMTEAEIRQLYAMIAERKRMLVTGLQGLHLLKRVLEYAVHRTGVVVLWDPSTPPALRDRLTIMSLSALQWSVGGAVLGMSIGVWTDKPATWTAVAAGIAALLGAVRGSDAVRTGWRLRGYRDEHGVECVEVEVITRALPAPSR